MTNNLETLKALALAAKDDDLIASHDDKQNWVDSEFIAAANPETIAKLIEIVEELEAALRSGILSASGIAVVEMKQALARLKTFREGKDTTPHTAPPDTP